MGIRIHKMIGYGLTDLTNKYPHIDSRINPEGILNINQNEKEWTKEEYKDWITKRRNKSKDSWEKFDYSMELQSIEEIDWSPEDCFKNGCSDYGLENVACVIPYGFKDWYRYDNIIDYIEESKGSIGDYVKTFDDGFYPYIGTFIDSRNGKTIEPDGMACYFLRRLNVIKKLNAKSRKVNRIVIEQDNILQGISKSMGFVNTEETLKYMAPKVPAPIKFICEFGQAFTSPEVIWQLRPILYVYWG